MRVVITNTNHHGPISEGRLQVLENRIETALPPDYRKFLEHYNGGQPAPNGFWIIEGKDSSGIHQFYGLYDDLERLSIDRYTNSEWGIPERLLPIGDDGVGNLICIGIGDEERGAIYFVDHEIHPYSEPNSFEGITKLANSFTEFLSALKDLS